MTTASRESDRRPPIDDFSANWGRIISFVDEYGPATRDLLDRMRKVETQVAVMNARVAIYILVAAFAFTLLFNILGIGKSLPQTQQQISQKP